MCNSTQEIWIQEIIVSGLLPIVVGIISYLLVAKLDDWKKRRQTSKLGVAVLEGALEEVKNGIKIMSDFLGNQTEPPRAFLPNKSWHGTTTINDEVLLRIIASSEGVESVSFPPREIRIHLKNYFDFMTREWDKNLLSSTNQSEQITIAQAKNLIEERKFLEAANQVKKLIEQTIDLLEKNSKRCKAK